MEALRIVQNSGLVPKRTIRCVLFVDEECRQSGAKAYLEACRDVDKITVAMETDLGAGPVIGFGFTGGEGGLDILRGVLEPMDGLNDFKASLKDSKGKPVPTLISVKKIIQSLMISKSSPSDFRRYFNFTIKNTLFLHVAQICLEVDCVNRVDESWAGYGVDTYPLVVEAGVPGVLLRHEDTWWFQDYFHHHHTAVSLLFIHKYLITIQPTEE